MEAVVQRVRTSWTKKSRGGPEAVRRNAVPTAFLLPPGTGSALHDVTARESGSFEPLVRVQELSASGLILREAQGLLRVGPPEVTTFGMPRRNRRPPAVRIAPGQWLRWQINFRFVGRCDGSWSYQLGTFNISYGSVSPEVFLSSPTRDVDERGTLR
ncbi:hypothetical protein ACFW42_10475 [Streptomyces albidoflavus]